MELGLCLASCNVWSIFTKFNYYPQDCETSGVTLDYLQKLHEEYVKFIQGMRSVLFSAVTVYTYVTHNCITITTELKVLLSSSLIGLRSRALQW